MAKPSKRKSAVQQRRNRGLERERILARKQAHAAKIAGRLMGPGTRRLTDLGNWGYNENGQWYCKDHAPKF